MTDERQLTPLRVEASSPLLKKMTTNQSATARIEELKALLAKAQNDAAQELRDRRTALAKELADVDAQIAELTGEAVEKPARKVKGTGKSIPLQELKELLAAAPDKTISIRKEGLELRNIKVLAEANPSLLKLGGKGPWPTVTLLK